MELGRFEGNVRDRTKTESSQLSLLFNEIITDICHQAFVQCASTLFSFVKEFYRETVEVTESGGVIDISGLAMASVDPKNLSLRDSVYGEITVVDDLTYNEVLGGYTTAELAEALFARVTTQIVGTGETAARKLVIVPYRGTNKTTGPGDIFLTFIRVPSKQTDPEKMVDFPDRYMMVPEDYAVHLVTKRLDAETAADVDLTQGEGATTKSIQELAADKQLEKP